MVDISQGDALSSGLKRDEPSVLEAALIKRLKFQQSQTTRINRHPQVSTSSAFWSFDASASTTIAATMSQSAKKNSKEEAGLLSAQPTGVNEHLGLGPLVTRATIGPGSPRGSGTATPSISSTISTGERILAAHLDITPSLQKATHSVVKARNGNVLSRGLILKTDHYPSGECFEFWRTRESKELCRAVVGVLRSRETQLWNFLYIKLSWDLPLTVITLSRKGV